MIKFLLGGILLVSSSLAVYDRRFGSGIVVVHNRLNKSRSSRTQCVVTLFKAEVISRVNAEYQFDRFRTQYVTSLKSGIYIMHSVKWRMTILFLKNIRNCNFSYFTFKDYSLFCIDINIILFFNIFNCFPTKQYNSMLCLCTVNYFLQIYIFNVLSRIKFY